MSSDDTTRIQLTHLRNLAFTAVAAVLLLRFVDEIAGALALFMAAFFFALVLDAPVTWLQRRGVSRGLAAVLLVTAILVALGLLVAFALPPLGEEMMRMGEQWPATSRRLQMRVDQWVAHYPWIREQIAGENVAGGASAAGQAVLLRIGRFSLGVVGGLVSLVLLTVITLYAVANPRPLVRGVISFLPLRRQWTARRIIVGVRRQVNAWVRATFWMMLIVGIMCGVGMWALGVKYALLFGVLAGIGEAIPTIGPIITAVPPFLVTLADDPTRAVGVLVLFIVVQQVENNLLVPRIMASALNLHPVSVLFYVVVMGAILGPVGILFATPLCAITKVLYSELYIRRRNE